MARVRTEITEIVTGLGLLGYRELDHALGVRPRLVSKVNETHFDRLVEARESGSYHSEFETAWANGLYFAAAEDGLRGRPPHSVEWKGPDQPPSYEQIPADLRVDHVYLISCKYGSDILMNASPAHLFDRLLVERRRGQRSGDWFHEVSAQSHQALWDECRSALGDASLPQSVCDITSRDRDRFKETIRPWPSDAATEAYHWLAVDVSRQSAQRWMDNLNDSAAGKPGSGSGRSSSKAKAAKSGASKQNHEEMLWRLLRYSAAPYFVLGQDKEQAPLRYRVATPWDFRERFELRVFDAWGDGAGQPQVRWRAEILCKESATVSAVEGHVEVRWSHGRFGGMPEAKIYLDTPHHQVPGYFAF